MGFTSTITGTTVFGNKAVTWGTWDAGADTLGDIDTGLRICEHIQLTVKGATVAVSAPANVETMPIDGNAVSIYISTGSDVDGYWWAFGDIYEG